MPEPVVGKFLMSTVHVSDHEQARKFYSETLGFKLVDKNGGMKLSGYDAGGMTFATHVPRAGETGRGTRGGTGLMSPTDDIARRPRTLKDRGARIGAEPAQRHGLSVRSLRRSTYRPPSASSLPRSPRTYRGAVRHQPACEPLTSCTARPRPWPSGSHHDSASPCSSPTTAPRRPPRRTANPGRCCARSGRSR